MNVGRWFYPILAGNKTFSSLQGGGLVQLTIRGDENPHGWLVSLYIASVLHVKRRKIYTSSQCCSNNSCNRSMTETGE